MISYAGKPIETLDIAELGRFRDYVKASRDRLKFFPDGMSGVKDANKTLRAINEELRRRNA